MTASNRREVVQAVGAAIKKGASQEACCEMLSLCERRLQRWRIEAEDRSSRRISGQEPAPEHCGVGVAVVHYPEGRGGPEALALRLCGAIRRRPVHVLARQPLSDP